MPLTDANNSVVKVPEEDFTVARGQYEQRSRVQKGCDASLRSETLGQAGGRRGEKGGGQGRRARALDHRRQAEATTGPPKQRRNSGVAPKRQTRGSAAVASAFK